MRVLKVLFEKFTYPINKKAGDWDDAINIPDIAEMVTDDNKEKQNPLCSDFWQYRNFFYSGKHNFHPDTNYVANSYKH